MVAPFEPGGYQMSISSFRRVALAACCALLVSSGCGSKPEVVRIGAILPLSGAGAGAGNQHLHGLQLAIEELNGSNPAVQYELVVDSDGSDPAAAAAAFKSQLLDKKILVCFVVSRFACLAVTPKAEVEVVPVFAGCKHPLITTMHLNAFRIVPNTLLDIKTTAGYLASSLKVDRASVLYLNGDDGHDAAKALKNELPARGIKLLVAEPFIDDPASIKSAVSTALSGDPAAVYVFGAGRAAAGILAGLRAAGFKGPVVGSSDFRDPAFAALAGTSLEGCYYAIPALELSGNAEFAARYQKKFNAAPTPAGIFAYDAMRIVAKSVDIKRVERINIANAMKKIGDFSGPGGNYVYADREWAPRMNVVRAQGDSVVVVY
jgi:branched-chain amino acid transport system substrate-binding protein